MTRHHFAAAVLAAIVCIGAACTVSPSSGSAAPAASSRVDPEIAAFVGRIRAVDNHTHANSVAPGDADADALPLDGILPIEMPAPLRPENPAWLAAYRTLYDYPHNDTSDAHLKDLHAAVQRTAAAQGDRFPEWVLDRVGTEVLLANRIAMGPGLRPPRVRWVSYVDALMFPLSNKVEAAATPDREKLFPLEDKLLQRYMSDLHVAKRPDTLDVYLATVVTPTLEAQRRDGCVAVKFEAAYLRALDFAPADAAAARAIYAKYSRGGEPTQADYKTLQDFLFRYIARESGRLGMAVHIHAFEGFGNYYRADGADPQLLESAIDDPALRTTTFVIVHGGGLQSGHTGALLWKPNAYADISMLTLAYPPARLAAILREWLTQFPEKVLFGSDAAAFGPDQGWEVTAWIAGRNARVALSSALSDMVHDGEIDRARAEAIATMVMRTNAGRLYKLDLK